jgi:hypothetical protein
LYVKTYKSHKGKKPIWYDVAKKNLKQFKEQNLITLPNTNSILPKLNPIDHKYDYNDKPVIFRNKQDEISFGEVITHNKSTSLIKNAHILLTSNTTITTIPTNTYTNINSSNVYDPIDIKISKSQDEVTWHINLDELSLLVSSPSITNNTIDNSNKLTTDEELLYNHLSETETITLSILNNQSVIDTNPIVIYCDGSYRNYNSPNATIGIGWFIENITDTIIYSAEITNHRKTAINAELLSIFHIVLAMPSKKKLLIINDNVKVVNNLNNISNVNHKNDYINTWDSLYQIIKKKQLKIIAKHIPGYKKNEQNYNNRIADYLARKNILNNKIQIHLKSISGISWKNQIVSSEPRKFIKKLTLINNFHFWKEKIKPPFSKDNLIWFWQQNNKKDHMEKSKNESFAIKILCNNLPNNNILHKIKNNIYKDDKCKKCLIETEDTTHIIRCNSNTRNSLSELFCQTTKEIFSNKKKKIKTNEIISKLENQITYSIDPTSTIIQLGTFNCSKNLYDRFKPILNNNTHSFISKLTTLCNSFIRETWKTRNKYQLEWEKNNNITDKIKRTKGNNNNNKNKNSDKKIININNKTTNNINNNIKKNRKPQVIHTETEQTILRWIHHGYTINSAISK